jgi:hypothetical protein
MTRLRGRCLKGQRLRSKARSATGRQQTFIAGLRCHGLTAPFVVDAPMNRRIFETYVETQLVQTLEKGDVVILDNLSAHKSPVAVHGSCSCRPTAPTSIQSKWHSQNSKPICIAERSGPSTPSGKQSAKSASSSPPNAETISPPQDMDSLECPTL